jgi:hypothetical protein
VDHLFLVGQGSEVKMRTSQFLAPLFFAATSIAQAVEEGVAPDAAVPEGCRTTVEGKFTIGTLENPALNRRETAQEVCNTNKTLLLQDYMLTPENRLLMAKFTAPSKTASSTTNTAAPAPSSQTASSSSTARPKQAQSTRAASRYAATTRSP